MKMQKNVFKKLALLLPGLLLGHLAVQAQVDIAPDAAEVYAPFGRQDLENFKNPPKVYYPETWFHFIGSNISKEGITADLEAINAAGISGIQWFHGDFGGKWPKVESNVKALTPEWEDMVAFMGKKAGELGLRFTLQTCPGWAMAGGPWVKPKDAMRHLAWSRTDVEGGETINKKLPLPQKPEGKTWEDLDYQDVCVLAFPTPLGDTGEPISPTSVESGDTLNWKDCFQGRLEDPLKLEEKKEHTVKFTMPKGTVIRTLRMPSVRSWNHSWAYQPEVHLTLKAVFADGSAKTIADLDAPMSNWQDYSDFFIACNEVEDAAHYEFTVKNEHSMELRYMHFLSGARKNNWSGEAGWALTSKEKYQQLTEQTKDAFVQKKTVIDISSKLDTEGNLVWKAPKGKKWTILRIGHINTTCKNAPAPKEATGWECNKLDTRGADVQFSNYVGHLFDGPLEGKYAGGMLMDSWECMTQTWTDKMEQEFSLRTGYELREWLPAIFGYVVDDQETTCRFLLDWRRVLNDLYTKNFFKHMTDLAHAKGLKVQYETAAADIVPIDALEYYKYADVPMCEFWQPFEDYLSKPITDYKPIRPTASAARLYGKLRVAAETFTSSVLTWDEHWEMLKGIANMNMAEGVTHNVFHTYTHNPQINFLPPGTSFGSLYGTPFLRQQTWWKYMPEFTGYLARMGYLLERGRSVSDVLRYLGDEIDHNPDQSEYFPDGFKQDYCNPDVLLTRLSVKDGKFVTPEGQEYNLMWIPENARMLPETLEKLYELISQGGRVVGNAPVSPATLKDGKQTARRFASAVNAIWGGEKHGIRNIGKGKIAVGMSLDESLVAFGLKPDLKVMGGTVNWLHRRAENADWYYVTAPAEGEFHGKIRFRAQGSAEEWDAVTGKTYKVEAKQEGEYQTIDMDLVHAQNCFIVFRRDGESKAEAKKLPTKGGSISINRPWTVNFPQGWGAPEQITVTELKPWKDLPLGDEGKSFSGTAKYSTTFVLDEVSGDMNFTLDLGDVNMIADVKINGKKAGVLWANPYTLYVGDLVKKGENTLEIDVTSTWYNRLAYDAGKPEAERKTWTISGPKENSPLHNSGLMGPVRIRY